MIQEMHRTLAALNGDVNARGVRICFAFSFWTPSRRSREGPDSLTGIVVALSRQSWAPALLVRSGRALELQEVEAAAAAGHRGGGGLYLLPFPGDRKSTRPHARHT